MLATPMTGFAKLPVPSGPIRTVLIRGCSAVARRSSDAWSRPGAGLERGTYLASGWAKEHAACTGLRVRSWVPGGTQLLA